MILSREKEDLVQKIRFSSTSQHSILLARASVNVARERGCELAVSSYPCLSSYMYALASARRPPRLFPFTACIVGIPERRQRAERQRETVLAISNLESGKRDALERREGY